MDYDVLADITELAQDGKSVQVNLRFKETIASPVVEYVAAAPPDYRMSFAGSGLPFANADQAFANTPNRGEVRVDASMTCNFKLVMPNSYMVQVGTVQIPPTVYISFVNSAGKKQVMPIKLSDPIPFRMMTYPSGPFTKARSDPTFYDNLTVPIGTQEEILRASAYPTTMKMPDNFWGQKPPL
jgi:hypothetical protein